MGPIGSGKSVACCWEIMCKAAAQEPYDGIRKSRWVIVRNTYRELIDTTMATWFDWFPPEMGIFKKMDMKHIIERPLPDGTKIHLEVLFRALDKPEDIKKLLSLELTGGWLNECREIPKAVLDMLIGRLGRYPSQREGGPTWWGAICDTNPPDEDHWWYKLFEENCPDNYILFKQPSGTSAGAENLIHLPKQYYQNMMTGKDQEWINVYVHGNYGFVRDGKPVYPEYRDDVHFTSQPITYSETDTIYIGIDFGLTPAATFAKQAASGKWYFIDELVTDDMGALNFGKMLGETIRRNYRNNKIEIYGDPGGEQRAQTDEQTPYDILAGMGIIAYPTHTNDFSIRRETVANQMMKMAFDGTPAFCIGPRCRMLRKAMNGGYKYKRLKVSGSERYHDKVDKNMYSHVAESAQYLLVGAGQDMDVVGMNHKWSKPIDYGNENWIV